MAAIAMRIPTDKRILADHPRVQFNYYRPGIGNVEVGIH